MKPFDIAFFGPPNILSVGGRGEYLKLPVHSHDGLEITYLERGHVTWLVDGQPSEVHEGSVFYTFPWETHGSANEYDHGHYWHFVILRGDHRDPYHRPMSVRRSLSLEKSFDTEIMQILEGTSQRCWPASERIAMTMKELVEESLHPKAHSEEMQTALSKVLILELARIVSKEADPGPRQIHAPPKVKKFLKELSAQLDKKWTLSEMSARCNLHPTHFTIVMRHATGDPPMRYLRRLRIDHARKMLKTKASITRIAMECGFESSQHFARIFRDFTGQSASGYRKSPHAGVILKR